MSAGGPEPPPGAESGPKADEAAPPSGRRGPKRSAAQTMGGILFGFEQRVLRSTPPPHELVHHARPDAPVPSGDGAMVSITLPDPVSEPIPEPAVDQPGGSDAPQPRPRPSP